MAWDRPEAVLSAQTKVEPAPAVLATPVVVLPLFARLLMQRVCL